MAAAFFSSFRASEMPKHLVSYALRRLELLDPESLNTENLMLKLGSKSEAEFTNVGIIPQVGAPTTTSRPLPCYESCLQSRLTPSDAVETREDPPAPSDCDYPKSQDT